MASQSIIESRVQIPAPPIFKEKTKLPPSKPLKPKPQKIQTPKPPKQPRKTTESPPLKKQLSFIAPIATDEEKQAPKPPKKPRKTAESPPSKPLKPKPPKMQAPKPPKQPRMKAKPSHLKMEAPAPAPIATDEEKTKNIRPVKMPEILSQNFELFTRLIESTNLENSILNSKYYTKFRHDLYFWALSFLEPRTKDIELTFQEFLHFIEPYIRKIIKKNLTINPRTLAFVLLYYFLREKNNRLEVSSFSNEEIANSTFYALKHKLEKASILKP
jgi:hypothetical protein